MEENTENTENTEETAQTPDANLYKQVYSLIRSGANEEALARLEQHPAPENSYWLMQMVVCLYRANRLIEAMKFFHEWEKGDYPDYHDDYSPFFAEEIFEFGKTMFRLGHHDQTIALFKKYGTYPHVIFDVLDFLYDEDQPEIAVRFLEQVDDYVFEVVDEARLSSLMRKLWRRHHEKQIELERNLRFAHLGLMASGQAHQLNQPIGIIRAAVNATLLDIRDGLFKPEDVPALLEKLLNETDRMAQVTDAFREFARGDRAKKEKVSINHLIQKTADLFRDQFQHRNIQLQIEPHPDENATNVLSNFYLLQEVLINLMTNAREAVEGREGAEVFVRTLLDGNEAGFIVEDNGPGLPKEEQENIFVPFVSSKSTQKNSGLGLYISQKMVDELKGRIHFENRPNGGTRLSVHLPAP